MMDLISRHFNWNSPDVFISRQAFHKDQLGHFPSSISKAIRESGILDQWGTDFSWLQDHRIIEALLYAERSHDGRPRKNGSESRLIHEIWCAHQIHNNSSLNNWLRKQKFGSQQVRLDPLIGVFSMIVHDCIENNREIARRKEEAFDPEAVINEVAAIWGDPETFPFIRHQSIDYMTDEPGLKSEARIAAQAAKSYNTQGIFQLSVLQQSIRMYDKLSHVYLDARYCASEYQRHPTTAVQKAKISIKKARMKSYPLQFPLGYMIYASYRRSMRILKAIAEEKAHNTHNQHSFSVFIDHAKAMFSSIGYAKRVNTIGVDPVLTNRFLAGVVPCTPH